ncbi:MAG: glycosyltransferase family 39 protein, partial [Chromatiaceae bacterium]|nr:glycosyltransferase family 39 protein [Chromatiaceae bacterium]
MIVWAFLLLLVLTALWRMTDATALIDPDEGRNAEVAREMAESGDFIVPHLNRLPYLDKPILLFSAAAICIRALGATELAARLPTLTFTFATVALVTAFGWRRFGRDTGLLAGLMLATAPLVMVYAGIVIFDALLMFWVSAASIAFHLRLQDRGLGWCLAGWTAVGLGVLTKGPVGLLLPLLIGTGEAIACRVPMRRLFHPAGIGVFLLLVLPWFLAVTLRHPEFPHYAFVRETFERVATDSMRRTAPFYYFLPILLGGAFPWSTLLLVGAGQITRYWRERTGAARDEAFLLLWLTLPFLFFTLSQSKRPGYILPVIPALTLLAARILRDSSDSLRRVLWISAPLAAALGGIFLLGADRIAERIDSVSVSEALLASAPLIGTGLVLAAAVALAARRFESIAIAGLALMPIMVIIGGQRLIEALGEQRSAREMSRVVEKAIPDDTRIIGINTYPSSLSYYLEANVHLATLYGTELRSNYILDYL